MGARGEDSQHNTVNQVGEWALRPETNHSVMIRAQIRYN